MQERRYKFLDLLVTAFVVVLLVSNLVAQKICKLGPLEVSAAVLLFPITYIFGDIFTEVYGYAASRRAIWLGFFATGLLATMGLITISLPSAPAWKNQAAFTTVFGFLPRIFAASLVAYWAGEFANSYTLSRLKLMTEGKWLWTRTIGSTIVGQAVDTALVIVLTFGGKYAWSEIVRMVVSGYFLKVAYETLATPLTYAVVFALKRAEGVDTFDRSHDYNPFSLSMPEGK
jgi:uncharacterized integral membrane protein (TIGR00697 family)